MTKIRGGSGSELDRAPVVILLDLSLERIRGKLFDIELDYMYLTRVKKSS